MSWFNEQIQLKRQREEQQFSDACKGLASIVTGKKASWDNGEDSLKKNEAAILEIMKYYHVKPGEGAGAYRDLEEQLEFFMRPSGMMRRTILLEGEWYKDCIGALLGFLENGDCVALVPKGRHYFFYDPEAGKNVALDRNTSKRLKEQAYCFYKPLPDRKLTLKDLGVFMVETLTGRDYADILAASFMVSAVGLIYPYVSKLLYETVVPSGSYRLLAAAAALMAGVALSSAMFSMVKSMTMKRLSIRISIATEAAVMGRMISLPMSFFKKHSAGELAYRMGKIRAMCLLIVNTVAWTLLGSLLSLIYIGQLFQFASALVLPAVITTLLSAIVTSIGIYLQTQINKECMEVKADEEGFVFAVFSGIQKIKLSGAEKRAFIKWAEIYKKIMSLSYGPPFYMVIFGTAASLVTVSGSLVLYYFAARYRVPVADYMAFQAAYGIVGGAFARLAGIMGDVASVQASLTMAKPIMEAAPENSYGRRMVSRLSGAIEVSHLSFRYNSNGPDILDDLSLKIKPGQYVAVVGRTGCGKSTLMRLLLGFETPDKGAIYYDGKDLQKLDFKSLRRKIGTVLQNGALISGNIMSNILISAPWLGEKEAWEAARIAGLEEDIKRMPMGMMTMIGEGNGGISGGQRQRLMIARAVVAKPKILMFDEATSALDNITQKKVSDALDQMKCTRIVIAHRLSTIRECDRIIVLDKGRIAEDGSYEELLKKQGMFAQLVARQQM